MLTRPGVLRGSAFFTNQPHCDERAPTLVLGPTLVRPRICPPLFKYSEGPPRIRSESSGEPVSFFSSGPGTFPPRSYIVPRSPPAYSSCGFFPLLCCGRLGRILTPEGPIRVSRRSVGAVLERWVKRMFWAWHMFGLVTDIEAVSPHLPCHNVSQTPP